MIKADDEINDQPMLKVGHKLKKLRELRNFTQEHMAKRLRMTQGGYSKIETGENDIALSKLAEAANVLEVPIEDIITFDERRYFNNPNNIKGNNNGITIQTLDEEIKKLYEDKIALLEQLVKAKEEIITQLRRAG